MKKIVQLILALVIVGLVYVIYMNTKGTYPRSLPHIIF